MPPNASFKGEVKQDFFISDKAEPHAARRKEILLKYPEIEKLFEPDARPVPLVLAIIASQLLIAYFQHSWSWWLFILVTWTFGGAASHSLSLMTHEVSHNLVFKEPYRNEWFGILCNMGMAFPSSTIFKRYHMEHHRFQGDRSMDCDLPTSFEGSHFTSILQKALWVLLMPLTYGARPQHVRPKKYRMVDIVNTLIIIATNGLVCYFCGVRGLLYLILSTILGMGFHPCAGHFIAEHFVFVEGQETYSYYGILNMLCWNVGYHNEHHDFPRVPGWKLPLVKSIASEYYDLPAHGSWTMAILEFIVNPRMSPFSRVVRNVGGSSDPATGKVGKTD